MKTTELHYAGEMEYCINLSCPWKCFALNSRTSECLLAVIRKTSRFLFSNICLDDDEEKHTDNNTQVCRDKNHPNKEENQTARFNRYNTHIDEKEKGKKRDKQTKRECLD